MVAEAPAAGRVVDHRGGLASARQGDDGPGQFAFADPRRVTRILEESGWGEVDVQPLDLVCTFPERELSYSSPGSVRAGVFFESASAATRASVIEKVVAVFAPFLRGDAVRDRVLERRHARSRVGGVRVRRASCAVRSRSTQPVGRSLR